MSTMRTVRRIGDGILVVMVLLALWALVKTIAGSEPNGMPVVPRDEQYRTPRHTPRF